MNSRSILLFGGAEIGTESQTFDLPVGAQWTVVATGLQDGDSVEFEIVVVNKLIPGDPCCPGPVTMHTIIQSTPLMYWDERVQLTNTRPYVIIEAPQGSVLRAILNSDEVEVPLVWATRTDTSCPSEYQRGWPERPY